MSRLIRLLVLISLPFAFAFPGETPQKLWQQVQRAADAGEEHVYEGLMEQLRSVYPDFLLKNGSEVNDEREMESATTVLTPHSFGKTGHRTSALREFHVIPPEYASAGGNVTFTGPAASGARTYQLLIHDTLLTAVRGRKLTGLAWRLPSSATGPWPSSDITYGNFEVFLSGSVPPANRSLTFSDNVVGPQTRVRTGALPVQANTYASGSNPNEWGPEIKFAAWTYTGGHLLVEIRHTGFTGTSRSVDAAGTSVAGYGSLFSALWQSSVTPTTGLQGNFAITRLTSDDSSVVSVGEPELNVPGSFALQQNYPNPFNPATVITYQLPSPGHVTLKIYDLLGLEVVTLVNEVQDAGVKSITWNASDLPSGLYLYRLTAGNYSATKRMVLIK